MGEAHTGKHFTCADDIKLLMEANYWQPWSANKVMEAWDEIAGLLRTCESFPQDKDGKALSTRFNTLIKKHRDNTVRSMWKSGREEDFLEREQLLEDIDAKMRYFKALKIEEKAHREAEKRKRDVAGAIVLRAAVGELESTYDEVASDEDAGEPPKKKQVLEAFLEKVSKGVAAECELDRSFKERKLELLERQLNQQQLQLDQQQQVLTFQREQFQHQTQIQAC